MQVGYATGTQQALGNRPRGFWFSKPMKDMSVWRGCLSLCEKLCGLRRLWAMMPMWLPCRLPLSAFGQQGGFAANGTWNDVVGWSVATLGSKLVSANRIIEPSCRRVWSCLWPTKSHWDPWWRMPLVLRGCWGCCWGWSTKPQSSCSLCTSVHAIPELMELGGSASTRAVEMDESGRPTKQAKMSSPSQQIMAATERGWAQLYPARRICCLAALLLLEDVPWRQWCLPDRQAGNSNSGRLLQGIWAWNSVAPCFGIVSSRASWTWRRWPPALVYLQHSKVKRSYYFI